MGAVKAIKITEPRNPNKWGKTLAPWFDDKCREAKKQLHNAKRSFKKGDSNIAQATMHFMKVCQSRRAEFAKETPEMLKY